MVRNYNLVEGKGNYEQGNIIREIRGHIRLFSDGGLLGLMRNSNKDLVLESEQSIILGCQDVGKGLMNFLTLSPNPKHSVRVSVLEKQDGDDYVGGWSLINGVNSRDVFKDLENFHNGLSLNNIFPVNDGNVTHRMLSEVSPDFIKGYLGENVIDFTLEQGKLQNKNFVNGSLGGKISLNLCYFW